MFFELLCVFDAFDAEEGDAEEHRQDQHRNQERSTRGLGCPDGEHHGQAAADQNGGVSAAEPGIDRLAGGCEITEVPTAIDQVGAEQAPEEHDFGGEEDPHAEAGGIALLPLGGEVVQERRVVSAVSVTVNAALNGSCRAIGQREPPLYEVRRVPRSYRLPRSLPAHVRS